TRFSRDWSSDVCSSDLPYHIRYAFHQQLMRDSHVSYFRHAWISFWPDILEDQHTACINVQIRVINSGLVVFYVFKYYSFAGMLHHFHCSTGRFEYGPVLAEISFQYDKT